MTAAARQSRAGVSSVVLLSGGLDSAVLLGYEAQQAFVHPVYVSAGLAWEPAELRMVDALLTAPILRQGVGPLASLAHDMRDVYGADHWAVRGTPPAYDTPDEHVYLPGRNVVLLTRAALLAASLGSRRIVIGTLSGNPFPDATPQFIAEMSRALSTGLAHDMRVVAPFASLPKDDVIRLGVTLRVPLELTLSCMNPLLEDVLPVHCGECGKCRERRDAFSTVGITDPAPYAARPGHSSSRVALTASQTGAGRMKR